MLRKKLKMYRVPLQQLKLNYTVSTTNKKVYTEEEDRFLLVMLDKYGLDREGVYDLIRDEIRESPLFRFDWFFLSRTPQEISRRCTTLITTVAKEMEGGTGKENKRAVVEDEESEEIEEPTKKKSRASTGGAKVSSHSCIITKRDWRLTTSQNKVVNGVKATPNGSSRAASVDTNGSAGGSAKKGRSRKR
jgi:SWI/SNF-related matrix-associated actin-dependent regulator of chromatin subfamily A member 5